MGNVNISRAHRGWTIAAINSKIVNGGQVVDIRVSDGFAVHELTVKGDVAMAMIAGKRKVDSVLDVECYVPATEEEYAELVLRS